jgi:hypothetical protein
VTEDLVCGVSWVSHPFVSVVMTAQRAGRTRGRRTRIAPVRGLTFPLQPHRSRTPAQVDPLAATRMANPHAMYTCTKDEEDHLGEVVPGLAVCRYYVPTAS